MPERTCVVCRKTDEQENLLRFVLIESGAVVELRADSARRLSGRGVYCHRAGSCLSSPKAANMVLGSLRKARAGNLPAVSIEEGIFGPPKKAGEKQTGQNAAGENEIKPRRKLRL